MLKGVGSRPRRDGALEIAVVGYGHWGPKHVRVLTGLPGVRVTVVEHDSARRAAAATQHPSARIATDLNECLDSVDAVVIATVPSSHSDQAMRALRAGRHVLVEKPMATSVAEAEAMTAMAAERGVILMVGHTYLYSAAVRELKQIVDSGELGRVLSIDSARLNLGRYQSDCDVVWDLAPHDISILAYLLGEFPRTVSAWAHRSLGATSADLAYLRLEFARTQVTAFVRTSWLDPHKCRRATVVGDKRMVVYDDTLDTDRLRVYDVGRETVTLDRAWPVSFRGGDIVSPFVDFTEPLLVQARHFLACIRTGRLPHTPGAFGVEVVRVLAAADVSRLTNSTALVGVEPDLTAVAPAMSRMVGMSP